MRSTIKRCMSLKQHGNSNGGNSTRRPSTFNATLLVSTSSLLLATGLAMSLWCSVSRAAAGGDDDEHSEAGVLARTAAQLAFKWAVCSACASLVGTVGVLLVSPSRQPAATQREGELNLSFLYSNDLKWFAYSQ